MRRAVLFLALIPALLAERIPGHYIVELSTEPVVDRMTRQTKAGQRLQLNTDATTHRARIRAEQSQLRQSLVQHQAEVLEAVDTVANAMFVRIPDERAAELATLPGVKRVVPMRQFKMVLDRATQLHRVNDAWAQIGPDRSGEGVKIAIIDSGIDVSHPGFADATFTVPSGYPKVNYTSDTSFTNAKVIVARSYVALLPYRDPDFSARDRVGHGTALAMIAGGVTNTAPLAQITGVAPRALLGNYKIFGTPGYNDNASDAAILKAIDDAVADGMDVLSLSFGDSFAPRLEDDLDVQAIERASKAGVIVVAAAGNSGPTFNTMSSPATAPSAIAVGALTNDRTFSGSVDAPGLSTFLAVAGDGPQPSGAINGMILDVEKLDGDGLGCGTLQNGSLTGRIALIQRGTCTFETKLNNAQRAGALGAVIYARQEAPAAIRMSVGAATLPAQMVSHDAGVALKGAGDIAITQKFDLGPVSVPGMRMTDFSGAGPNVDGSIKPELAAVGQDMYTATQRFDVFGDMFDDSGYILVDGTSFSTPFVAGVAALIKSARPGLSVDQYRSLLINTAAQALSIAGDAPAGTQQVGAGSVDALAALQVSATSTPATLSFGAGGSSLQSARTLSITNASSKAQTFQLAVKPKTEGAASPSFSSKTIDLAPGQSIDLPVNWSADGLTTGTYEGSLLVTDADGRSTRIPYWYAATDDTPSIISLMDAISTGRRGSIQRDAVFFRVLDGSGVLITDQPIEVSVLAGNGSPVRVNSYDSQVPGLFSIDVRLGVTAGSNTFRIRSGQATLDVTIAGQ